MQFCLASSLVLTDGPCLQFLVTEWVRYHACAYHMTPYDLLKFGLNWNLQKAVRSHALQFLDYDYGQDSGANTTENELL